MSLVLKYYRNRGDIDEERVVMQAAADVDIGDFILCQARREGDAVFPDLGSAFWFPDKTISKGDYVVLYSKVGVARAKTNSAERTTHFFYLGEKMSRWGGDEWAAVLMLVASWNSLIPDGDTTDR